MADRDAKVRLNLAANGFLTQLQQLQVAAKDFEKAVEGVGDGGEKASKKLGALGTAAKAGLGAAKSSLAELGSSLKSTLGQVATLGGALSAANALRGAVEVTKTYKDLANAIEAGTGEAMSWQTVQASVEGTAARWKRSNQEVAESYRMLWDDIGDAKFASAGIESVARAATAGHGSVRALTTIVGQLKEKFDIPTEGIDDALASVIAMGNKGGASVEDLGEKIGILGASAKEAGIEGQAGLTKMVSMLNLADGVTGNFRKSLKAVTGIFDTLGDPEKLKAISKELHMNLVDQSTKKPFAHALEMILAKSGGKQEVLAKVFSGEELKLVTDFGKVYAKAFAETTGDIETKMHAGLEAYNKALKAAGKSTADAAMIDKQAKDRLADVDRQVADAMRQLEIAFTKPEMVAGLTKLAEIAPKVADALAKLLGLAVDHPKAAAAAVVGAKVIPGVVAAVVGSVARSALTAAAGGGAAAATTGAGAGLLALAGPAAVAGGAIVAGSWLVAHSDLNKPKISDTPTNSDKPTIASVFQGNRPVRSMDDLYRENTDQGDPVVAARNRKISDWREMFAAARAPSIDASTDASPGMPTSGGPRGAHATTPTVDQFAKSVRAGGDASARAALSMARAADAADQFAARMGKLGAPTGSNGLPTAPGNEPGSTPR